MFIEWHGDIGDVKRIASGLYMLHDWSNNMDVIVDFASQYVCYSDYDGFLPGLTLCNVCAAEGVEFIEGQGYLDGRPVGYHMMFYDVVDGVGIIRGRDWIAMRNTVHSVI